ncbi:MAG: LptF/LptG family permease [Pyrinomonadaceae bacterium]|nr:LptF/LptG family permease [Pyrinomonadaceae bacterium]
MKRFSWLISKYLVQAVLPYFVFSWLLLSVILFVQQASRYSDIFFSVSIPKNLIWQLTFALVPNVVAFTCPMAVLVGVIIGLSRMLGDSELIAIRSAGVGNFQITVPIVWLGVALSVLTFIINLYGVPFAARIVRQVALQTALRKLASPIEPGVFNSEINGYTIYVKNGDFQKGTWENIFIYNEDQAKKEVRLITSKSGRIDINTDTNEESSELVLQNAVVSTISNSDKGSKFISENVGQFRFAIKTKRGEIIDKLTDPKGSPEELGLTDLVRYASGKEGKEKIEAQIIWQRRILLSVTPLIFALLGTALVLRFNRGGGKGLGIFLALVGLVFYYLMTLLGEQLARTEAVNVSTAGWLPLVVSASVISYLFLSDRIFLGQAMTNLFSRSKTYPAALPDHAARSRSIKKFNVYLDATSRILDFDIIQNLLKYFALTVLFLTTIYLIFTAFELWKFAGEISGGALILAEYLFFLLPFIYLQLSPSALMIATLVTFVIKSRQNEIVSWTAAGQSVYRLLLPCFALMILFGILNFGIQEYVAPKTNVVQDDLRARLRSRGVVANKAGKFWVANNRRIYSFEMDENKKEASQKVKNLLIYEFSPDETRLQNIYRTPEAVWETNKIRFSADAEKQTLNDGKVELIKIPNGELAEISNPFNNLNQKPSHLNRRETLAQIEASESDGERRNLEVALEKKYTTLFLPFVITLFTAPFALSLSRRGRVVTVGYAVGVWLLFMGITGTFEQFGLNGYLAPVFAVWSPLFLFSIIGAFLLSRVRT